MPIDRSKRSTFLAEAAEPYHEVRPSHPEELVEDASALSGVPAEGRLRRGFAPDHAHTVLIRTRRTC